MNPNEPKENTNIATPPTENSSTPTPTSTTTAPSSTPQTPVADKAPVSSEAAKLAATPPNQAFSSQTAIPSTNPMKSSKNIVIIAIGVLGVLVLLAVLGLILS